MYFGMALILGARRGAHEATKGMVIEQRRHFKLKAPPEMR